MTEIKAVPPELEAEVLLRKAKQPCEHPDCPGEAVYQDYCEEHAEYYFCECGQRLEDAAGSPGDGFCPRCR